MQRWNVVESTSSHVEEIQACLWSEARPWSVLSIPFLEGVTNNVDFTLSKKVCVNYRISVCIVKFLHKNRQALRTMAQA
jgi:hypothetical protein